MKKFIIGIKENSKVAGIAKRIFPTEDEAKGYMKCLNEYKNTINLENCTFEIVEVEE